MIRTPILFAALSVALMLLVVHPAGADSREAARKAEAAAQVPSLAIGQPAPDFEAVDSNGKTVKLSSYKGQIVVLEWTNSECPYVKKFYDSNTMQEMQKDAKSKNVVWLSVLSSAKGQQGYMDGEAANRLISREKAEPAAFLLDPDGKIGRLYNAATTPHMYVIDRDGNLAYAGAMDDQPSVSHATLKGANNYVKAALDSLQSGTKVAMTSSKPYGCSVKY